MTIDGIMLVFLTEHRGALVVRNVSRTSPTNILAEKVQPFVAFLGITEISDVLSQHLLFAHPVPKERYMLNKTSVPSRLQDGLVTWEVELPNPTVHREVMIMDFGIQVHEGKVYQTYGITNNNVDISFVDNTTRFYQLNASTGLYPDAAPEYFWDMIQSASDQHSLDIEIH